MSSPPRPANVSPSLPEGDDGIALAYQRLRTILLARLWWLLLSAGAIMALVVIATRYQQPVYEATDSLVINSTTPRILGNMSEVMSLGTNSTWFAQGKYYEAQREILQSREVAQMVVDRNGLASDPHLLGLDRFGPETPPEERQKWIEDADPASILARKIRVSLGEDTMVARVSVEDTDPVFAANIVNWVMEAYRDRNLDQRRRTNRDAFRDLRQLQGEMERRKARSEAALIDFETKNDLSENRQRAVAERLMAHEVRLRDAEGARFRSQQRLRQLLKLQRTKNPLDAAAPGLEQDTLLTDLKRRYVELMLQRKELDSLYLEQHPRLKTVQTQLEQLLQAAQRHVDSLVRSAKMATELAHAEEREATRLLGETRSEDTWLRKARSTHEQMINQRDEDKKLYVMVATRLAETDLTGQVEFNNVSILDTALAPTTPIRPRKSLNYAIGLLLALVGAVAVAVAVDFLDATVKDRRDIEEGLQVPFLGVVPTFLQLDEEGIDKSIPDEQIDLFVHLRPSSRAAEAARSLRTALLFSRPENPPQVILMASALPREGKTTTATTLAITLAAASGSCILVDADLRKPRLHRTFGFPNTTGLTNYAMSGGASLSKLIRETSVPGLHFLPCGPIPPNAAEVLHTERFRELVRELRAEYENVIFDSSPVEIVSDALVLATMTDGVVLVAHAGYTRKDWLSNAVRSIQSTGVPLLGVTLSRADRVGGRYGYYYGRGYGGQRYEYRYDANDGESA